MKSKKKFTLLTLLIILILTIGILFIFKTKKNTYRLSKPISVYITWGAHDNLSDTIPLSENLVFKQLCAIRALKKYGAHFDYFVLDAGWADTLSSCRKFNTRYWPHGPEKWIKSCQKEHLLPGLWFPINLTGIGKTTWMSMHSTWKTSKVNHQTLSLSEGNFLNYHIQTFQYWYNRGIRLFKLDFALFNVATSRQNNLENNEIIKQNEDALFDALYKFKQKNKDAIFLAYNGFGGEMKDTYPHFRKTIQTKWLAVFEALYSGDPRPSDIPCSNFWRSKDIYSDHMVKQFQLNGIPLNRIDNCSFMIGNTGTCYQRQKASWKATLLLSLARGGWVNTYYGDLSLLNSNDKYWFSKAQSFWLNLQQNATCNTIGNIPGTGKVYGYYSENSHGKVITLVNPSQTTQKFHFKDFTTNNNLLLFTDNGRIPQIKNKYITLGPEQMIILGTGKYATKSNQLGHNNIKHTTEKSRKLIFKQTVVASNQMLVTFNPKSTKKLHVIFILKDAKNQPIRLNGGSPPNGDYMSDILNMNLTQNNRPINFQTNNHKQIWSGMSWALGEVAKNSYTIKIPLKISFNINKKYAVKGSISCEIYEIDE